MFGNQSKLTMASHSCRNNPCCNLTTNGAVQLQIGQSSSLYGAPQPFKVMLRSSSLRKPIVLGYPHYNAHSREDLKGSHSSSQFIVSCIRLFVKSARCYIIVFFFLLHNLHKQLPTTIIHHHNWRVAAVSMNHCILAARFHVAHPCPFRPGSDPSRRVIPLRFCPPWPMISRAPSWPTSRSVRKRRWSRRCWRCGTCRRRWLMRWLTSWLMSWSRIN